MKNVRRTITVLCLMLCLCCGLLAVSAMAADEETTYVVAFRPGAYGSFSEGAESYLSAYGTVTRTGVGSLFVEIKAGTGFPVGIASYIQPDEGYYFRGWGLDSFPATVSGDGDFVADYGILPINSYPYRVLFVDSTTHLEVAEPIIGYSEASTSVPASAKTVTGYKVDEKAKSVTITVGGSNSTVFYYTLLPNYVYEPDKVIVETATVTEENAAATTTQTAETTEKTAESTPTPTPAAESVEPVEIEEEGVPMTSPEEEVVVEEEETPQSPGVIEDEPESHTSTVLLALLFGALLAIIAYILLRLKKRAV